MKAPLSNRQTLGIPTSHINPSDRVSLPLLENGLDFLASAVEHLRGSPSDRDLKYAVLHLASGIELVLKERLRQHDAAQLFQRPEKFDPVDFQAGNFRSVNAIETVSRLVNVAGVYISESHRLQVQMLRDKRNRIEHFGFEDTADAVLAATAATLGFAVDFIAAELDSGALSPAAIEELQGIRSALPEFQAFVVNRWVQIQQDVAASLTAAVTCSACGEDAAVLDEGPRCLFCGYATTAEDGAEEYATVVLGLSRYVVVKDGGDWVVSECPNCERDALVDVGTSGDEHDDARWICFGCGEEWRENALWECSYCGRLIPAGEGEMEVCSDCFRWRVESSD